MTTTSEAITNGVLTMTRMKLGESITGEVVSVDPAGSKYGATFNLKLQDGSIVKVLPSGNVKKFFVKDLMDGTKQLGRIQTFTRIEDYVSPKTGIQSSQFRVRTPYHTNQAETTAAASPRQAAQQAPAATEDSISSRRARVLNATKSDR